MLEGTIEILLDNMEGQQRNKMKGTESNRKLAEFHYTKKYMEYNKALRTWFIAFGIGGPVIIFTNEAIYLKIAESGSARWITLLFLAGTALQIVIALLNKHISWCCYYGELNVEFRNTFTYKAMSWLNNQLWIDVALDILSIFVFTFAIIEVLGIFT